jgi:sugar phosphate isomerase/epimerase
VPARLAVGWVDLLKESLPYMNFWHVKNYLRVEHPELGTALSYPTDLEFGLIDYRAALRLALAHGYDGPLYIEHYEGDTLWAIEKGRRHRKEVMWQLHVAGHEGSVLNAETAQ